MILHQSSFIGCSFLLSAPVSVNLAIFFYGLKINAVYFGAFLWWHPERKSGTWKFRVIFSLPGIWHKRCDTYSLYSLCCHSQSKIGAYWKLQSSLYCQSWYKGHLRWSPNYHTSSSKIPLCVNVYISDYRWVSVVKVGQTLSSKTWNITVISILLHKHRPSVCLCVCVSRLCLLGSSPMC